MRSKERGMDLSSFYSDIVHDEIKYSQVSEKDLKSSIAAVCTPFRLKLKKKGSMAAAKSLKNGEGTFVNYHVPSNRCAYLRTLAPFQTEVLGCCFRKFIRESAVVHRNLEKSSVLKLCCVGGASGTNALGLLEVLSSSNGDLSEKYQVTILDSCDGWKNSSQRIIKKFEEGGKISRNLSTRAVEVDLSGELTDPALKAVQEADIVCIDRCASNPTVEMLIQSIAFHVKKDVPLILIGNCRKNVCGNICYFFQVNGIKQVLTPLLSEFPIADFYPLQLCQFLVSGWVKTQMRLEVVFLYTNTVCEDSSDVDLYGFDFSNIGKARKTNDLTIRSVKKIKYRPSDNRGRRGTKISPSNSVINVNSRHHNDVGNDLAISNATKRKIRPSDKCD